MEIQKRESVLKREDALSRLSLFQQLQRVIFHVEAKDDLASHV